VELQHCPYDGTPVDVVAPVGTSCVLTCATCRAQWEVHDTIAVRTIEPDWSVIRHLAAAGRSDRRSSWIGQAVNHRS
jgi:hypothetical protein